MTLDDLEKLVGEAIDPRDIFGEDVAGNLERFRAICQPDRNPAQEERAAAVLNALEQFARFTPEDIEAIGVELDYSPELREMLEAPQHVTEMPDDAQALREFIQANALR